MLAQLLAISTVFVSSIHAVALDCTDITGIYLFTEVNDQGLDSSESNARLTWFDVADDCSGALKFIGAEGDCQYEAGFVSTDDAEDLWTFTPSETGLRLINDMVFSVGNSQKQGEEDGQTYRPIEGALRLRNSEGRRPSDRADVFHGAKTERATLSMCPVPTPSPSEMPE
jgi:hypothetical protein